MSITNLLPTQIADLTADQIANLEQSDIASLTIPQLRHLTPAQFSQFSAAQIGFFSTDQIADLAPATVGALDPAVVAELSLPQLDALHPAQAQFMTAAQVSALSTTQVASLTIPFLKHIPVSALQALEGLTVAQVRVLPPAIIAELSAAQFAELAAANTSAYGAGRFIFVTPEQAATLTAAEANGLTAGRVQAFSGAAIGGMTVATLAALRPALVQALTAVQLNGMGATALSQLNAAYLTDAQLGSLTAATLASLSTATFDTMFGGRLADLSAQALAGVSLVDLASLSQAQLASFTSAQQAAMATAQLTIVVGDPVLADLTAHESNGALSYAGALAVLQDAANGGMTEAKFAALTAISDELNAGGIQSSASVTQIFSDVVLGNSANALWTGGGATPVVLGDLAAFSSQTQTDELIGKWFLGTDLPSFSGFDAGSYQTYGLPLFSSAPAYTDVNQGLDGDCYFLAALAETAKQDPSLIENMIQSNGNNTYSVEFQVDGEADYVTVNNQLPKFNYVWSEGSNMQFANSTTSLWVPLIEKAYAELMAQSEAVNYSDKANSYAAIEGGDSNGLTAITGQQVVETSLYAGMSAALGQSDLSQAFAAFSAGEGIMIATGGNEISTDWVSDHMYAVVGANASAGTLTLYNPWGDAAAASGMDSTFNVTLAALQQEGVTLEYAVGKPATA